MQYVRLTNGNIILHTTKKLVTITPRSFNFVKIERLLEKGAKEEEILPLLVAPNLPNGLFEVYIVPESNTLVVYNHVETDSGMEINQTTFCNSVGTRKPNTLLQKHFIGVYASMDEIVEDWPEYIV